MGVLLQYEPFPDFCFLCSMLDHKGVNYAQYNGGHIQEFRTPFGLWLRAGQPLLGSVRASRPSRFGLGDGCNTGWRIQPLAL